MLQNQESNALSSLIMEDQARMERHEQELNEVIDFHQKSMENMRTSIATMEERLQYQMNERFRDLQELIDACSNRVSQRADCWFQEGCSAVSKSRLTVANHESLFSREGSENRLQMWWQKIKKVGELRGATGNMR